MEALAEGQADLALGFVRDAPETVSGERLYDEAYLVVGRPDALPDAPRIDLDAYCAADHLLVSSDGDLRGVVDERLEAMGRRLRIAPGLPAFLPALAAAAVSGALVTPLSRVALAFAGGFGLATAAPPRDIRRFPVSVFWRRGDDADPRTIRIRRRLAGL